MKTQWFAVVMVALTSVMSSVSMAGEMKNPSALSIHCIDPTYRRPAVDRKSSEDKRSRSGRSGSYGR